MNTNTLSHHKHTIAAIATAPGRGGVGVVRLSGNDVPALCQQLFPHLKLKPRHATYCDFKDAQGEVIDQGLAIYFNAPHSYTGEDVLELQGHGGPVVLQMVLQRCLDVGKAFDVRMAEPGEFTQRAFLNDKLDLAQAEAVADLIEASTEAAAKSASQSMTGAFSKVIQHLVDKVVNLRMLVEATLDFPEEEIDFLEKSNARGQLADIQTHLAQVFSQAAQGALLREGLNVVLAGQPNVGKSSLLNSLAGDDIAIVTPIAGTTRDKIIETIHIEGIPLNIIDTAGIRSEHPHGMESGETQIDAVEKMGIQRTWAEVGKADVILHLLDATRGPTKADEDIASQLPENVPVICVWTKIDLSGHKASCNRDSISGISQIYISSQAHLGMDLLREELLRVAGYQQTQESRFIARERHLIALKHAREHVDQAAQYAAQNDESLDLFAEELRLTQNYLNSITGEFTSDDLLGVIFGRFCIGK